MNASATTIANRTSAISAETISTRRSAQPLPSPAVLRQRLPLSDALAARINDDRSAIRAVLDGHPKSRLDALMPWNFAPASSLAA